MSRFRRGRLAVVPFSRVSFRGRGCAGALGIRTTSRGSHQFSGSPPVSRLAPVPGIPTSLATRRSTATSTSLWISTSSRDPYQLSGSAPASRLAPVPGISTSLATRTSSRNLHQSRDSRKHWDLHQFWISTSPRDPYQLSGSAPPPRIRTNLATRTSFRDLHQLSGATPALGIHTASGRLDWVQIPKTGAVVGFPCVDMHQAVGGTHHPWGLPRGRRLRGNRNTSKQPSLGRSPEFVRDPLRDSATHGLTELPYGSQQLQPL